MLLLLAWISYKIHINFYYNEKSKSLIAYHIYRSRVRCDRGEKLFKNKREKKKKKEDKKHKQEAKFCWNFILISYVNILKFWHNYLNI